MLGGCRQIGSDVVGLLVFSVLFAMLVLFLSVEHFPAPPQSSMSLVRGCAQVQRGTADALAGSEGWKAMKRVGWLPGFLFVAM